MKSKDEISNKEILQQKLNTLESKTIKNIVFNRFYQKSLLLYGVLCLIYAAALFYFVYVVMKSPDVIQQTLKNGKGLHFWLISHVNIVIYILRNTFTLLCLFGLNLLALPLFLLARHKKDIAKYSASIVMLTLNDKYQKQAKIVNNIVTKQEYRNFKQMNK